MTRNRYRAALPLVGKQSRVDQRENPREADPHTTKWSRSAQDAFAVVSDRKKDPYLQPAFPLSNRLRRAIWNLTWLLLYRPSPRPFHAWRSLLLRAFGAKLGPNCHFYPASKVWAPWNLHCADQVTAADGVEIYNPALITLGSHAILSQSAYLCGATHDYNSPAFPLIAHPMTIGRYAWVCARASVAPGANLGEGALLGLGAVATHDLAPWTIYGGVPAIPISQRKATIL